VRHHQGIDEEDPRHRPEQGATWAKLDQELRGIDLRLSHLADPRHQIDLLGLRVEAIQRSLAPLDLNSTGNRLQIATIIARYELTSRERDLLRRKAAILTTLGDFSNQTADHRLE
jgi:hypothetical protein